MQILVYFSLVECVSKNLTIIKNVFVLSVTILIYYTYIYEYLRHLPSDLLENIQKSEVSYIMHALSVLDKGSSNPPRGEIEIEITLDSNVVQYGPELLFTVIERVGTPYLCILTAVGVVNAFIYQL